MPLDNYGTNMISSALCTIYPDVSCPPIPAVTTGRDKMQFICTKCVHKKPGLVQPNRPSRQVRTTCRDLPVRPYRPSRQVRTTCRDLPVRPYSGRRGRSEQLVATCLSGHTGRRGRLEQLVATCLPGHIPAVAAGQNNLSRPACPAIFWPSRQVKTTCRDRQCHRLTKVSVPAMSYNYYVVSCRDLSQISCTVISVR